MLHAIDGLVALSALFEILSLDVKGRHSLES
jgi:hypothetical protein